MVVPVEQADDYGAAARMALAVRQALSRRNREAISPSEALEAVEGGAAATRLDQALAKLQAGIQLYDGLDFKAARKALEVSVSLHREALKFKGDTAGYVKALHYLAAACFYDEDRAAAKANFLDGHAFAPKSPPDRTLFPPDVIKVFEQAVSGARTGGSLNVKSTPPAEVLVNDESVGVSPALKTGLATGRYLVRCRRGGFETDAQWIRVRGGAQAEVRTELRPLPGRLEYVNALAEAEKELEGTRSGSGIQRLVGLLGSDALLFVEVRDGVAAGVWFQAGLVTNRYLASSADESAETFAEKMLASGDLVQQPGSCSSSSDCPGDGDCVNGQCQSAGIVKGTPFYKTWWFWTVVGVAAAGAATGIVLGTVERKESWTAEITAGGMR